MKAFLGLLLIIVGIAIMVTVTTPGMSGAVLPLVIIGIVLALLTSMTAKKGER